MKGIILAGGSGTRLYPLTEVTSKQLLPIYDKPMICYPLATMMLLGITDILIISTPQDTPVIEAYLGDGQKYGLSLEYAIQNEPKGIAEAFIIGEKFIGESSVCLLLGDNIFHFVKSPKEIRPPEGFTGARIVGYHVPDPERFGVIEFSKDKSVKSLEEKPREPKSNYAAVGLYFYDSTVAQRAKNLKPSDRGELEITDLNLEYLKEGALSCSILPRGSLWMDAGTIHSLNVISNYAKYVEDIQNLKISCIEEIAYRQGYIDREEFSGIINSIKQDVPYRKYLEKVYKEDPNDLTATRA